MKNKKINLCMYQKSKLCLLKFPLIFPVFLKKLLFTCEIIRMAISIIYTNCISWRKRGKVIWLLLVLWIYGKKCILGTYNCKLNYQELHWVFFTHYEVCVISFLAGMSGIDLSDGLTYRKIFKPWAAETKWKYIL